jgi:hypothetical protein
MAETPVQAYEISTEHEDLNDVLMTIQQRETPLLDMVMNEGMALTNTEYSWVDTTLYNFYTKLNATITAADTNIAITVNNVRGLPVVPPRAGARLRITTSTGSELVDVVSVNSTTASVFNLTVTLPGS